MNKFFFNFKNSNKKNIKNTFFKKIVLYFGYTHCPDFCPVLINNFYNFIRYLKIFKKILFFFFSIDIEKDNSEISQRYLIKYKLYNWYTICLNKKKTEKISINFRIIYKIFKFKNKNNYKINHSNLFYFINSKKNTFFIKNDFKFK